MGLDHIIDSPTIRVGYAYSLSQVKTHSVHTLMPDIVHHLCWVIIYSNMKTEDRDSSNPHTPKASKTRWFMEAVVIMSETTLVTDIVETVFFTQFDKRSVLHSMIFISFYILFYFLYKKYCDRLRLG